MFFYIEFIYINIKGVNEVLNSIKTESYYKLKYDLSVVIVKNIDKPTFYL